MQRLCYLHILCYILYLVILRISFNEVDNLVAAVCDSNQVTLCANLGNISFPFGDDVGCAASESFVISNCSSTQASWEAFEEAVVGSSLLRAPPELIGLTAVGYYTYYINLTWMMQDVLNLHACDSPSPTILVDSLVPEVINLTTFGNGSFHFSHYNYYLLFNCSNLSSDSNIVEVESPICSAYKTGCKIDEFPCAQLKPYQELTLHETLESLSCSHFRFLATSNVPVPVTEWNTTTIQLFYGDVKCEACFKSGGQCFYNKASHIFEQCICGANKFSNIDCSHINSCNNAWCKPGAKIGIGVSVGVVGTMACMLLFFWVYNKRRAYSTKSFTIPSSNRLLTQRAYMLSKKFGPVATKEFSFESLSKATNSFADENMIGDGGFGAVYLGILRDGRKVAIKRLYHDNFKRMDHFYNEMKILSALHHPNLVKLFGFCCQDSSDLLLVFEYAANGTVSDQLHDVSKPPMPWKTRLNIARETAEALSYLHNSVKPPIYHRDVKTTNILLDDELHAKLADFGLSRLVPLEATHVSTAPQGTPGYLDPDYHQCYQLTDKSDVYSFGVVLMELVSAKLAVDLSRDRREINLSNLALMKIGCGMWEDLVDPRLEIKKNPEVETMAKRVVELAFTCLHAEKDNRPTMEYVAETLTKLCQEFGYGIENCNAFSFKVNISPPSSTDETRHLIRPQSATKSKRSAGSTTSSTNWSSSNTSSSSV